MAACSERGSQLLIRHVQLKSLVCGSAVTQRKACPDCAVSNFLQQAKRKLAAPCCGQAMSEGLQAQRTVAKYGSVPHTSHSASFSSGTSSGASATLRCRSHLRKCNCS